MTRQSNHGIRHVHTTAVYFHDNKTPVIGHDPVDWSVDLERQVVYISR